MPETFTPPNNQFALSTGSNVNSADGISTFDYPPNSSINLTITSNADDSDPNTFSVGETYDLSWGGKGGEAFIEDAVVIRSDYIGSDAGAVVFEGKTEEGGHTQLVWAPNFDLEQWYWDNFDKGASPGFYTNDRTDADYRHVCFAAGTLIATPQGSRKVEDLRPGERVLTLDSGPTPILWIGDSRVPAGPERAPVRFAAGTIGNARPLVVSPQHRILIRSGLAEMWFGAPEVFVPAKALVNGVDVCWRQGDAVRYLHLLLPRHEILWAEGAPAESLFLGDVARRAIGSRAVNTIRTLVPKETFARAVTARPALRAFEAQVLRPPPRARAA